MEDLEFTRWEKFTMWFNRTTRIARLKYFMIYDLPNFLRNVWLFRRSLTQFHWYNLDSSMMFMEDALNHSIPMYETKGNEVIKSKNLKIEKMKRLQFLLNCYREHNYIELAEQELGELNPNPFRFEKKDDGSGNYILKSNLNEEQETHDKKVFDRSHEIEKEQWNELIEIIKGKEIIDYDRDFDGTGIRNWWN